MRDFAIANTLLRSVPGLGYCIFAREDIPPGTPIGEYTGQIITRTSMSNEASQYHTSIVIEFFLDTDGRPDAWINAMYCGFIMQFLNHSCDPNAQDCEGRCGMSYRIAYLETRDIEEGEEKTLNCGSG
jgi:SET domain-containing protein